MIRGLEVKSRYLLGDGIYGMDIELLRLFLGKSEEVLTPIKDTLHMKVKNPLRKKVKEMYEANKEKYRERYIVEQVIGKIKNAYGRCERTKSYEMVNKSIWVKIILYNWVQVILLFLNFIKQRFRNIVENVINNTLIFRTCSSIID